MRFMITEPVSLADGKLGTAGKEDRADARPQLPHRAARHPLPPPRSQLVGGEPAWEACPHQTMIHRTNLGALEQPRSKVGVRCSAAALRLQVGGLARLMPGARAAVQRCSGFSLDVLRLVCLRSSGRGGLLAGA